MDQFSKHLLVVDDDPDTCALIADILQDDGYRVEPCLSGEAALEALKQEHYHLVLADIRMPRISGIDLLLHVRRMDLETKVILMTAYASVRTAVQAVRGAAFDYLVKPFSLSELRQCVQQALGDDTSPVRGVIAIRGLTIDLNARHVWVGEREVELTRREFEVLAYLAINRGRAVPWEEFIERIWDDKPDERSNSTLRSCIRRLRNNIGDDANNAQWIENVWGVGYRIVEDRSGPPTED
ncbi:MAG: response regulator transcription factor [Anaerolineae bacterium]